VHPQDDSAFRFRIRKRRVKTVNLDVGKNRPKLIGYHILATSLGLLPNLWQFYNQHNTSINAETYLNTGSVVV